MSRPLRIGLVGCGRLAAEAYLPAVAELDSVVVAAVADPDRRRAEFAATCAANGAAPGVYASAEELLAAGGVDAVVVASPVADHLASATAAARAGLPCLVEKPPAPSRDGAEALAELAPAPWIGFNRRFSHGAVVSRACAAPGRLELDLELRYRRASWDPFEAADDALLDLGVHLADLALEMGGEAEVVAAEIDPRRFTVELRTARGPARLRGAIDRPYLERTVARGEGFTASRRSGGLIDGLVARVRRREHPLIASIGRQLEAFATAARGGEPGELATAADGVRAIALIDDARRAAR